MRWRRFFQRAQRDDDLVREIDQYIAQEIDDNLERGMSPAEARSAAYRRFGNPTRIRETVYRMNTITWLDVLTQDIRYALRQMRRRPAFALAAIASLALGIGANTAIFTLVDQILLRQLPVVRPTELVWLRADGIRPGGNNGDGRRTFPYPTYAALRDRNSVFAGLTGQRIENVSLLEDARSELIPMAIVAGNYFDVLGVRPHLGRLISPDDDRQLNAHPVAVLQYDFWRTQFQARQDIVGTAIRLNGAPFIVIGVSAPAFEGTDVGSPSRVFVPVAMQPTVAPTLPGLREERGAWFYVFGRLKPGVTREQAELSLRATYRQRQIEELQHAYFSKFPETRDLYLRHVPILEPAAGGNSGLRSRFERPLIVLECLAAAVLLLACANVAGLLLARGAATQRDLAIRRAIGASRGRLVVQLLTESAVLAGTGAVAAFFLGSWMTQMLIGLLPYDPANLSLSATPDARVLTFMLAATVATALLFGLLPAWQNSRTAAAGTLRQESGAVAGARTHVRFRKLVVGVQVALSAMLLLGAGLFIRTLINLQNVNLGVDAEHVVYFHARPGVPYPDAARKLQAYRTLIEGLAQVPGVVAVGASRNALFTGGRWDSSLTIPGVETGDEEPFSFFNAVTPGYFDALGIPVTSGRTFTWEDWGRGRSFAVVNQLLTRKHFGGVPPIGRTFGIGTRAAPTVEIVGVARDAHYHEVRGELPRQTFVNMDSIIERLIAVNVYARAAGDPRHLMPALRAKVHTIDPNFVVSGMRVLQDQINFRIANERMLSVLSTSFAALAVVLAVVGVHGVLVFLVAKRTREIGIRVALGAKRIEIVTLVAREMLFVVLGGLAVGLIAAYVSGRYIEAQLFGTPPNDPVVYGVGTAALLAAALAATLAPALRASRIDPIQALRSE